MFIVQLDQNKYYTGSFAKVGSIPGGIKVPNLPNDLSNDKTRYWKWDIYEQESEIMVEVPGEPILVPVIDEETQEQELDENEQPMFIEKPGEPVLEKQIIKRQVMGWIFDQEKYEVEVLQKLKNEKIEFINNYKHEARMYFPYGNVDGIQRFAEEDINFINLTIQGLNSNKLTEVYWKYSNGAYDKVTDVSYFENMLLTGGLLLNKSFAIEAKVVEEINSITTVEELRSYNEKAKFDEYFNN